MLARVQMRALPVVSRASEHVPVVTACCNTCRTCVSSNVLGLAMAGVATAVAVGTRVARRLARRSV